MSSDGSKAKAQVQHASRMPSARMLCLCALPMRASYPLIPLTLKLNRDSFLALGFRGPGLFFPFSNPWRCPMVDWRARKVAQFLALSLGLVLARGATAQGTNASVGGRVTDPSKALIVGAKVAAVNAGTNVRSEGATNGSGEYYLTNLPPGSYRIEIEKAGFKKLIRPNVNIHVQDAFEIDFEMAVGSASETVTIEGGAPLADTESATVSTVIDHT